jgi:DUF438 domain-containing protein
MNDPRKFNEDKRIIGTPRYKYFQQMCSEAGLFAIKEAKDRGLPITYVENEEIVKEYADGRKEILGRIKPRITVKKRVFKIK